LGKFWRVLKWKMLACFIAIWSVSRPFGIFWDFIGHLVIFPLFWYAPPKEIWQPWTPPAP
jgi:hypothetical protein